MKESVALDLLLVEADRVLAYRMKDLDLYYKDPATGEFKVIVEAWDSDVEHIMASLFKRKKLRYFTTFSEAWEVMDNMQPSASKLFRWMGRAMSYGNVLTGYSVREISYASGVALRYVIPAIATLVEKDCIKFVTVKNHRTYMLNPMYMYKGSLKKIFWTIKDYDNFGGKKKDYGTEEEEI